MNQRTVYVVDDNLDFLQSAKWWLEGAGFDVCEFDSPMAALDALAQPRPHACLLLDVRMPGMSGLAMHDELRDRGVSLPVVYMTGHGDVPLAVEAMRKGAVTFIEKPFADEALQQALELAFEAADHQPPVKAVAEDIDGPTALARAEFASRVARLTPRENQVIELVLKGRLNKLIADALGISIKTVELHRKNAMTKLNARSVIELTRLMVTRQVN